MTTEKPCILCAIDAFDCSEDWRRAVYYLVGSNQDEAPKPCEKHILLQASALQMLAVISGHGEFADSIREAVKAPKLRLVPPPGDDGSKVPR